jgi:hypothetical protein
METLINLQNRHAQDCENQRFTSATRFCDAAHPLIVKAARNIVRGNYEDPAHIARQVYYWVRDNINYQVGLWSEAASQTLQKGEGSCANKSNLVAALLRALQVPCGFITLDVKTREYFGDLCPARLSQFMSYRSLHVLNCVAIGSKWIEIDASDDIRLSQSTSHLTIQSTELEFDGYSHCNLKLNPDHVLGRSPETLPCIDFIFEKKRQVPQEILFIMNCYLGFMRRHCITCDTPQEVEERFFEYLGSEEPEAYERFLVFEAAVLRASEAPVSAQAGEA